MPGWYEKNLGVLDEKTRRILRALKIQGESAERPGGAKAFLNPGPKGDKGLALTLGGREIRLTSALNPLAEDKALVDKFFEESGAPQFFEEKKITVLGFGLGYHLEELFQRLGDRASVTVLESRPELLAAAMTARDLRPIFQRPGFRLFLGPFKKNFLKEPSFSASEKLWRPVSLRLFRSEYEGPEAGTAFSVKGLKLLIFQSGYFLNRELLKAAEKLGLATEAWTFEAQGADAEKNYKSLLEKIKKFRPQMILAINHLGFDQEGLLADILNRLNIPVASWFVDSPFFVLGEDKRHQSPGLSVFSWDEDYLEPLKKLGFEKTHFLPLATSPDYFHEAALREEPRHKYCFVGDSLHQASLKFLGRLGLAPDALKETDAAARKFLANDSLLPDQARIKPLLASLGGRTDTQSLMDFAALITWRAGRLWRREVLEAFEETGELALAGDEHWGAIFKAPKVRLLAGPDYYGGLAALYRQSAINLNITSAQMKNGLNQRVFDAPASGAFLLTDYRRQVEKVFSPDKEVVCYREAGEARELADWYAQRPLARRTIVEAAQKRIAREHHYSHRLLQLIRAMKEDHGL